LNARKFVWKNNNKRVNESEMRKDWWILRIIEEIELVSATCQFEYILLRGEFTSQLFPWNGRDI